MFRLFNSKFKKMVSNPCCGLLMSQQNQLIVKPKRNSDEYVIEQTKAMKLKAQFLNGDSTIQKDMFFKKFHFLNNNLQDIDYTFKIDKTSKELLHKLNVKKIIEKRRQNALVL